MTPYPVTTASRLGSTRRISAGSCHRTILMVLTRFRLLTLEIHKASIYTLMSGIAR